MYCILAELLRRHARVPSWTKDAEKAEEVIIIQHELVREFLNMKPLVQAITVTSIPQGYKFPIKDTAI